MGPLVVDVWSDVVCPWCYIGKRRLEQALAASPYAGAVSLRFHAFELDPKAPRNSDQSLRAMLAAKYRASPAQVEAMEARVTGVAAEVGIEMRLDRARPENTFDAHRLIAAATAQGKGPAMKERLMLAYFCEGQRIGDAAVLGALAAEVGVEGAAALLADPQALAAGVRQDEAQAQRMGVTGVPFFVFDGRLAVSGGQPAATFRAALDKAWGDRPLPLPVEDAGAVCGPDGCAI